MDCFTVSLMPLFAAAADPVNTMLFQSRLGPWKVEAQGNRMEIREVAAYIAYITIFRIANVHCPKQIAQVRSELSLGARAL